VAKAAAMARKEVRGERMGGSKEERVTPERLDFHNV